MKTEVIDINQSVKKIQLKCEIVPLFFKCVLSEDSTKKLFGVTITDQTFSIGYDNQAVFDLL